MHPTSNVGQHLFLTNSHISLSLSLSLSLSSLSSHPDPPPETPVPFPFPRVLLPLLDSVPEFACRISSDPKPQPFP
ncbi:hypothetical protein RIF29_10741 [Crotalaria pallida]|uniref:Uncharacterized protein n=1 Tax=Crotalaria pallida TaxID=3830 RepID=A0AAN9IK05_CROPI